MVNSLEVNVFVCSSEGEGCSPLTVLMTKNPNKQFLPTHHSRGDICYEAKIQTYVQG